MCSTSDAMCIELHSTIVVALGVLAIQRPAGLAHAGLACLYVALSLIGATTVSWMLYAGEKTVLLRVRPFRRSSCARNCRSRSSCPLATSRMCSSRHRTASPSGSSSVRGHRRHRPRRSGNSHRRRARNRRGSWFSIVTDVNEAKNKPKALNIGLPECTGDVVGVFDAEDWVATLFSVGRPGVRETGTEVVQGATQLMNFHSSWFAVRNVLEYYFWFKSRLHFHAQRGSFPWVAIPYSSAGNG